MHPEHGREHPWHIRRVSHRHLHDKRNLDDLHALTRAWLGPAPALALPASPELDVGVPLEDDTWPEDVLQRLEGEIHAKQLATLRDRLKMATRLEELSFQAGEESASRRWMQSDPNEGSIAPADKRALLLALYHSPLGGRRGPEAFLVRRALITEVSLELRHCPHRLAEAGALGYVNPTATPEICDELCHQQFQWLKGYFNFLNPAIMPTRTNLRERCVVSW